MRECFPIISNICSGRVTGINFQHLPTTDKKPLLASPFSIMDISSNTKHTVDSGHNTLFMPIAQDYSGSSVFPLPS